MSSIKYKVITRRLEQEENIKTKKDLIMLGVIVTVSLVLLFGASYAVFNLVLGGSKTLSLTTGTFKVDFVDRDNINLENTYPMSDSEGLSTNPYKFSIENTGDINARYRVYLEDGENNTLRNNKIKISYKVAGGEFSVPVAIDTLRDEKIIVSDEILNRGALKEYELKLWLDESAGNESQNKLYQTKIVVEAIQNNGDYKDTTPPIITLSGEKDIPLVKGSAYTDQGVSKVVDNIDGTLANSKVTMSYEYTDGKTITKVDSVDTSKVGAYFIHYRIEDSTGNVGRSVRTISITNTTSDKPAITLVGDSIKQVTYKTEYIEEGVTATGYRGKDIGVTADISDRVVTIGKVNTNQTGTYIIKYIVVDSENNITATSREVRVIKSIIKTRDGPKSSENYYAYADKITSVTFDNKINIPATTVESWDVSQENNETVKAYIIDDGLGTSTYELHIQADGNTYAPENSSHFFRYFTKLLKINNIYFLNTEDVINMQFIFNFCLELTGLDVRNFDTSKVTSMYFMFDGCSSLTSLDVNNFDTSNVTNMSYMFDGCSSLTSLDFNNFNTSNVTDMTNMFMNCSNLTSVNVNAFDTSNVTNMSYMFGRCESLVSLNVSGFDTGNVIDMQAMFTYCWALTSLNLKNFDTSNVTNMLRMFDYCNSLISLDIGNFNTSNVTNMGAMFGNCSNLTSLNVSNFDASNVTNMSSMFYKCSSLTSIDVSSFNTSNVTSMSRMFYVCNSLTSLDLTSFNTSNVTNMSDMFYNSSSLTSIKVTTGKWVVGASTDINYMFTGCGTQSVTFV